MKKLFLLLFLITTLFYPNEVAKAESTKYSRIMTDNVMLFIDSSLTIEWFVLPKGYYVKVVSVNSSSAKVEYKSDNPSKPSAKGYISTEHLNIVDGQPPVLYPNLTLTVNQNCILFKDVEMSLSETVTQNSTIDYYGMIEKPNGERYIYGLVTTTSGDKYVGYLPFSAVYDFTPPFLAITENNQDATTSELFSQAENQTIKNNLGNTLQLVIIIAVSIIAISVVYLLFKPSPTKASDEVLTIDDFYDE